MTSTRGFMFGTCSAGKNDHTMQNLHGVELFVGKVIFGQKNNNFHHFPKISLKFPCS